MYAPFSSLLKRRSPGISAACFSCLTCAKYSSEMRPAHSMHCSMGLHGLEMSAHFINMRLIRIRFSGDVRTVLIDSPSPLFCNILRIKSNPLARSLCTYSKALWLWNAFSRSYRDQSCYRLSHLMSNRIYRGIMNVSHSSELALNSSFWLQSLPLWQISWASLGKSSNPSMPYLPP